METVKYKGTGTVNYIITYVTELCRATEGYLGDCVAYQLV